MSASTTKDRYTIIGIHPVPAHLSTKEFAANLEALADVLLARPIAQSNVLKWHMLLPNDQQASPFNAAGFPELQPVVVVQVECETREHYMQCLSDEAVAKSFSTAPEFTATTVFGTDMVTDIDTPASEGDIIRINIYRCPPNLSTAEFYKRMREFLQEFGALPVVQKHVLKYTRWEQNSDLAENLQAMGMSAVKPVVVTAGKVASLDDVKEVLADGGYKQLIARMEKSGILQNMSSFCADVVTKIDRA